MANRLDGAGAFREMARLCARRDAPNLAPNYARAIAALEAATAKHEGDLKFSQVEAIFLNCNLTMHHLIEILAKLQGEE